MVSQETYIFMGTTLRTLAYARPEAARQAIVDAAIAAHATSLSANSLTVTIRWSEQADGSCPAVNGNGFQ